MRITTVAAIGVVCLLASACQRYHGRPALVRGDERRSYGELLDHGARLANALQQPPVHRA